jgi:hypothetical protein
MPRHFVRTAAIGLCVSLLLAACQTAAPQPTPTPVPPTAIPPTAVPTAAPSPTPAHPAVKADAIRLDFTGRTMIAGSGDLEPGTDLQCVFTAAAGQQIKIKMIIESGTGAALSLWGADGTVVLPETTGITEWQGVLPTAQDYYLDLHNTGPQLMTYQDTIILPPLVLPQATRIQFQPGTTGWYTPGEVPARGRLTFVLSAQVEQLMTVDLVTNPVNTGAFLNIWSPDGINYTSVAPTQSWSANLPATQDYYIEVVSASDQPVPYQLSVNIAPLGSKPDSASAPAGSAAPAAPATAFGARIAVDQVIRFDAGPMAVDLNGAVISGERDRYRFSARAGETLDVIITSMEANAVFTILGPDNNPLPGTEEGKDTNNWSVPLLVDGTYTILVGPTRGNATYTLSVKTIQ